MVAEWKRRGTYNPRYYCSNCYMQPPEIEYICPFCGAEMTNYIQILDAEFLASSNLTNIAICDIINKKGEGTDAHNS